MTIGAYCKRYQNRQTSTTSAALLPWIFSFSLFESIYLVNFSSPCPTIFSSHLKTKEQSALRKIECRQVGNKIRSDSARRVAAKDGSFCRYRKPLYFWSIGISLHLESFCFLSFITIALRNLCSGTHRGNPKDLRRKSNFFYYKLQMHKMHVNHWREFYDWIFRDFLMLLSCSPNFTGISIIHDRT